MTLHRSTTTGRVWFVVRCSLLVGSLLVLPPCSHASLYSAVRAQVETEVDSSQSGTDPAIAAFVAAEERGRFGTDSTDIEEAERGNTQALCGAQTDRPALSTAACQILTEEVRTLTKEASRVQQLGRDLLAQTIGWELTTGTIPGRGFSALLPQAAVMNLWRTGGTANANAPSITTQDVESDVARPLLQAVAFAFAALTPREQSAAVHRYRDGVRLVAGLRAPRFPAPTDDGQSGPGTPSQESSKRLGALEAALLSLWNSLAADTVHRSSDAIVELHFPEDLLRQTLPENLIVWANRDPHPPHSFSDIGLAWRLPLETLSPSLLTDPAAANGKVSVILGGAYPPAPADGTLCSHPREAQSSYLCRPLPTDEPSLCPPHDSSDPAAIVLTTCTAGKEESTAAGPDVCSRLPWLDNVSGGPVCSSAAAVSYANRIGNDVCFIGQCAEAFLARSTNGRQPALSGDDALPWFNAVPARLGGVVARGSAPARTVLPAYVPAALLQEFDAAVCARSGRPVGSPPIRCISGPARALQLPLVTHARTTAGILAHEGIEDLADAATDALGAALGSERGMLLFSAYRTEAESELAASLSSIVAFLTHLRDTPFPGQLCPLNGAKP